MSRTTPTISHALRCLLPVPTMPPRTYAVNLLRDIMAILSGRYDPFVPPSRLMFDGPSDPEVFRSNGREFLQHFIHLAGLQPHERVLDVGCGIGRKAIPLTGYLNTSGSYEGLDIVKIGITWCQEHITPRHRNFHFQWSDVYNRYYNPEGRQKASQYRFPFPGASFDLVILISVFTHVLPDVLENYVAETSRVLKHGGRCFITYFLLNGESKPLLQAGKAAIAFRYIESQTYGVADPAMPEAAVSYDESFILRLYEQSGLKVQSPVRYGSWCSRKHSESFQDIVIAVKQDGACWHNVLDTSPSFSIHENFGTHPYVQR